ncbi:MAG: hypothetical protein Q8K94_02005 [Moraxellaceae bacterium]|nr:hypothetical protein [Moraxellaceae bacterium]MDP1775369.1 hypothetical protein [Moraxellaceae bacterium]
MRKSPLFVLVAGALVLSGCASKPEPTFGQLLGDRASEYRSVKNDWQAGATLKANGERDISRGQSDIKKGEDMIKRGQRLVESGQSNVKRGETRVQQGTERMQRAEANYSELTATPAVPEMAQ